MPEGDSRSHSLAVQVAVLASELHSLRSDVTEIRESLDRWIDNSVRERTTLLVAVISGWLGLIAAAVTALLRH